MRLENDDFMAVAKTIPDNSVDCVITDCPYCLVAGSISKKDNRPKGIFDSIISRQGKMFDYNDIKFSEWMPEVYRVLKNDTHCYIMINGRNLMKLQEEAEKTGFAYQNLLVWKKNNATPSQYYMNQCEFILLLKKGRSRYINNLGTMNCFDVPNIIGNKIHPTEKPVELMKIMVENSTDENDVVLDPLWAAVQQALLARFQGVIS